MKQLLLINLVCVLFVFLTSCNKNDSNVQKEAPMYDTTSYVLNYDGFGVPNIAEDNRLTNAGVQLGRMLFYEKKLSGDNTQSCADCHRQKDAFTDTLKFSIGIEGLKGRRQAMSVFNMAWHKNEFFWDGRAHLLRDQALLPIQDPVEMNESLENVIAKLADQKIYLDQFIRAFGDDEITSLRISLALEQFMNSIVSNRSKYDKYLSGEVVLTPSEERGRKLFFQEYNPFFPEVSGADCAHCHTPPNFENNLYMNNGLDTDGSFTDLGREDATGRQRDRAKFKVPTLRNIELTFPYMHDGRFSTLEQVIDHYNEGIKASSTVDPTVLNTMETGLLLDEQDKKDLVNFLKTLTDKELLIDDRYSNPF